MAKKRSRRRPRPRRSREPAHQQLDQVDALLNRRRWEEAAAILHDLESQYPRSPQVLGRLAELRHATQSFTGYLDVCERLQQVSPDDPDVALALAGAYLLNVCPLMALDTFEGYFDRWPGHDRAGETRQVLAQLRAQLPLFLDKIDVSDDEAGLEFARWHEELRLHLKLGRYAQGRRVAAKMLQRDPHFNATYNNLSRIQYEEGDVEQAIETTQQLLAFEPDNVHALANMIQYLFVGGRGQEARPYAQRLKTAPAPEWELLVRKAEGLTYVGDDRAVLDTLEQFRVWDSRLVPGSTSAHLLHLAAVAALRLGDEAQARRLWQESLGHLPHYRPAKENLADLDRPAAERHAPWPFEADAWIDAGAYAALKGMVAEAGGSQQAAPGLDDFLREHPQFTAAVPNLLARGSRQGREFALYVAGRLRTPALLAALRAFATGSDGPEAMRAEAAYIVRQAGG